MNPRTCMSYIVPNLQTKIKHLYTSVQFNIKLHFKDVQD